MLPGAQLGPAVKMAVPQGNIFMCKECKGNIKTKEGGRKERRQYARADIPWRKGKEEGRGGKGRGGEGRTTERDHYEMITTPVATVKGWSVTHSKSKMGAWSEVEIGKGGGKVFPPLVSMCSFPFLCFCFLFFVLFCFSIPELVIKFII